MLESIPRRRGRAKGGVKRVCKECWSDCTRTGLDWMLVGHRADWLTLAVPPRVPPPVSLLLCPATRQTVREHWTQSGGTGRKTAKRLGKQREQTHCEGRQQRARWVGPTVCSRRAGRQAVRQLNPSMADLLLPSLSLSLLLRHSGVSETNGGEPWTGGQCESQAGHRRVCSVEAGSQLAGGPRT